MVHGLSNKPHCIRAYYGCYGPLRYPLFVPRGEAGWNKKILYDVSYDGCLQGNDMSGTILAFKLCDLMLFRCNITC